MGRVAEVQRFVIATGLFVITCFWIYRVAKWTVGRVPRVRRAVNAWNVRVAEKDFVPTATALQKLGLDGVPTEPFREAGKRDAATVRARYQLLMFAIGLGGADLVRSAVDSIDAQRMQGAMEPRALATACTVMPLLIWLARRSPSVARYRFLLSVMSAIEACEEVASSRPDDRHKALQRLDDSCSTVRRSLLKAHLIAGSTGRRSPRRRRAKGHAALVVAKLQMAEAEIDVRGNGALRGLAALLVKIGNGYAAGNVSNLLPEQSLRDVTAVPNREGMRTAAVVMVTAAALCSSALAGFPDVVIVAVTGSAALLSSIALFGARSATAKASELMGILWR